HLREPGHRRVVPQESGSQPQVAMGAAVARGLRMFAMNVAALAAAWVVWDFTARAAHSAFFPAPAAVAKAVREILAAGDVQGHQVWAQFGASVVRVFVGFAVAAVTGVALGMVLGLKRGVYDATKSLLEPVRFIPPIAWIPLAIVMLSGFSRYAFIIWIGAFFPILVGTMAGIQRVSPLLVEVSKAFGAKRPFIVLKVVTPGALPEIVAGLPRRPGAGRGGPVGAG